MTNRTEEVALMNMGIAMQPDLLELLKEAIRRRQEDALLRDIVRDNRAPVHPVEAGRAAKVSVAGAPRVVSAGEGNGWVKPKQVDDWRPPGINVLDRMMDAEDRQWRLERARQLGLKGGE
jgi:hypothetical protein